MSSMLRSPMERDQDVKIFKYPIPIADEFSIKMPKNSVILHVANQEQEENRLSSVDYQAVKISAPCMWVKVNTVAPDEERQFYLVGTGHPLPVDAAYHVGTFGHGQFIWHVFEKESPT